MKKLWKIIIGAVICLIVVSLIIIFTYPRSQQTTFKEEIDLMCLKIYAKDFCKNEAIENKQLEVFSVDEEKFSCIIKEDQRRKYLEIRTYYFLDNEINSCKILTELKGG